MQKEDTQLKGFTRKLPVDIQETLSRIKDVCIAAQNNKSILVRKVLLGITERLSNDLKDKITIDSTFVHSIESSAIIHNQKKHGTSLFHLTKTNRDVMFYCMRKNMITERLFM